MKYAKNHFICTKPKMKQCKLKTWTLNKTHQAQTSSYGGLSKKEYGNKNTQNKKNIFKYDK